MLAHINGLKFIDRKDINVAKIAMVYLNHNVLFMYNILIYTYQKISLPINQIRKKKKI